MVNTIHGDRVTAKRPNILLIITDHFAHYGHDRPGVGPGAFSLRMPRFERLAAEGTLFRRGYSVSPICTPARASMMTGRYPGAHGLRWNTDGGAPGRVTDFRPDERLFSDYL